ncbi:hypothetical protein CYMTET_13530 [Cymbomonas tetramitiformis]|uniref:Uncharacterized protein n=1 Tax=Cymbomonas tetramitiformis TaxID=36881 RepID=A0AAE0LAT3_9CHLO|nr:hypothetical protein CYMTET_13530 [Cymbomonas tetramitiformis]
MEKWNAATAQWPDTTGNYVGVVTSGSVAYTSDPIISSIGGSTATQFSFGSVIPAEGTICSLTRYTGNSKGRILDHQSMNWLHAHWGGRAGVVHYNRWQTSYNSNFGTFAWTPMCGQSGSSPLINLDGQYIGNNQYGSWNAGVLLINRRERSDFEVSEVIIWSRLLSQSEMDSAMDYLRNRSGYRGECTKLDLRLTLTARARAGVLRRHT